MLRGRRRLSNHTASYGDSQRGGIRHRPGPVPRLSGPHNRTRAQLWQGSARLGLSRGGSRGERPSWWRMAARWPRVPSLAARGPGRTRWRLQSSMPAAAASRALRTRTMPGNLADAVRWQCHVLAVPAPAGVGPLQLRRLARQRSECRPGGVGARSCDGRPHPPDCPRVPSAHGLAGQANRAGTAARSEAITTQPSATSSIGAMWRR